MGEEASAFVDQLSGRARVLLIGGVAMLAHGYERYTKDVDIWLEPMDSVEKWTHVLTEIAALFPAARFVSLPKLIPLAPDEIHDVVKAHEVVRITGLSRDVDVFRRPNNTRLEDFDSIWRRAISHLQAIMVPDEIDLANTKLGTGRHRDEDDVRFLDAKITPVLAKKLMACGVEEANAIFARLATEELCDAAMRNPSPAVRILAAAVKTKIV